MVSYDDSFVEQSAFDFDEYVFYKPEDEISLDGHVEQGVRSVDMSIKGEAGADSVSTSGSEMDMDTGERGIAPNEIFNMEPMVEAVHTPMSSRAASPVSIDEDSDSATLYEPSPSPRIRPTRSRLAKQKSQETKLSHSPIPLVERTNSPTPSSFSSSSSAILDVKVEKEYKGPRKAKKRSSGGRKGEPRRCQNMIAQKKYRDTKVHAAAMMSDSIVDIKAALKYASPKKAVALIRSLMRVYDQNMRELDPNLASKQDQAVEDQAFRYE